MDRVYSKAVVYRLTGKKLLKSLHKQQATQTQLDEHLKLEQATSHSAPLVRGSLQQEPWYQILINCQNIAEVATRCQCPTYVHQDDTRLILLCHLLTCRPGQAPEPIYRYMWDIKPAKSQQPQAPLADQNPPTSTSLEEKTTRGRNPDTYIDLHKKLVLLFQTEPLRIFTPAEREFLASLQWEVADRVLARMAKIQADNHKAQQSPEHPCNDAVLKCFAYKHSKNFPRYFSRTLTKQEVAILKHKISITDSLTEFAEAANLLFAPSQIEPEGKKRKLRVLDLAASLRFDILFKRYLLRQAKAKSQTTCTSNAS